jgi:hypothetical protein
MFVSIGTGESNPRLDFYPSVYNLLKLIKYVTGCVTNTDEVHQAILEKYLNDQPLFPKRCSRLEHRRYYRFNVQGTVLGTMGLDAFERPDIFGPVVSA